MFLEAANFLGGLVGIFGVVLGAASLYASNPTVQLAGLIAATATLILTVGWGAYRSFPPTLKDLASCVGTHLTLKELDGVTPRPLLVGLVGPSNVGKSTLLNHVVQQVPPPRRTDNVSVAIVALQLSPPAYIGIVDGAGQKFAQQFSITSVADALLVLADHTHSDQLPALQAERLKVHEDFSKQLQDHIVDQGARAVAHVHLLLNKMDLWQSDPSRPQLVKWFEDTLVASWKNGNWAKSVTRAHHSNNVPANVTDVAEILRGLAK